MQLFFHENIGKTCVDIGTVTVTEKQYFYKVVSKGFWNTFGVSRGMMVWSFVDRW
jgi:hypothetical protein